MVASSRAQEHYPLERVRLRLPSALILPLLDDEDMLTKIFAQLFGVLGRRTFCEHRHVQLPREALKHEVFVDIAVWCWLVFRVVPPHFDPLGVDRTRATFMALHCADHFAAQPLLRADSLWLHFLWRRQLGLEHGVSQQM